MSLPADKFNANTVVLGAPPSMATFNLTEDKVVLPLFRMVAWKGVVSTMKDLRSRFPRGERSTRNASVTADGGVPPSVVSRPGR